MIKRAKERVRAFLARQNEAIETEYIPIRLPELPPALEGFRLAVVADLHMKRLMPYHGKILEAVQATRPDCIIVAGDTIDERTELIEHLTPFFRGLSQLAPTIAILGNNDCFTGLIYNLRNMYRHAGVTLLENETRLLNVNGAPVRFVGLSDPLATKRGIWPERAENAEYMPLSKAVPPREAAAGETPPSMEGLMIPTVLLIHRPNLVGEYVDLHPSLVVSGHAHGGQFRLPSGQGIYSPHQGFFPKLTSGLYQMDQTQLIVSRGFGNHELKLRLNNPPHLPVAVFERA